MELVHHDQNELYGNDLPIDTEDRENQSTQSSEEILLHLHAMTGKTNTRNVDDMNLLKSASATRGNH